MLPQSYGPAVAVLLVAGGALACFAGYRLFRLVLAIYGFVLGAMLASSTMGISNTAGMIVAGLVGGVAGAVIFVFAYFVGIALVGAGLGAFVVHFAWDQFRAGDPPALAIIACAILGAVGSMLVQRYVIVVATAFGGAWTMLVGGLTFTVPYAAGRPAVDLWILYPLAPAPGRRWVPVAWIMLGLLGTVVQLGVTARRR